MDLIHSYFRVSIWGVCPFIEKKGERNFSMIFFVWQGECHMHLGRNVFLSRITDSWLRLQRKLFLKLSLKIVSLSCTESLHISVWLQKNFGDYKMKCRYIEQNREQKCNKKTPTKKSKKTRTGFSFCNSWEHDIICIRMNRSYGSGKQKLFVTADLNFSTDTLMETERIC